MKPNPDRTDNRSEALVLEDHARAGDATAAAQLLEDYRGRLVGFCHGYLGRIQDAEDAAQDVIAKMVAMIPNGWPQGSFRSWLYAVARNHCLNVRRHRGRSPFDSNAFVPSQLLSPRTGPQTAVARREREEQLQAAMGTLSPVHAEVLVLRYIEDLTRKEIATILDLSEAAVKTRLAKARGELALRLERFRGGTQ